MEVLSEHQCQGWLEGYLLTGRHGLFNCYEAFIHIVDSMFNQHAKWLKVTREHPVAPSDRVAQLSCSTSHVWRQDHNGFTHQDPGFIDHVVNKKAEVIRVYLPPDANMPALGRPTTACAAATTSTSIVAGQAAGAAVARHGRRGQRTAPRGIGIWDWASQRRSAASPTSSWRAAGDVPTLETLAAVSHPARRICRSSRSGS